MKVWGKILREYRESIHPDLRPEDVAEGLGYLRNRQTISQKETGKYPITEEELYKWLEILGLNFKTFCFLVEKELSKSRR